MTVKLLSNRGSRPLGRATLAAGRRSLRVALRGRAGWHVAPGYHRLAIEARAGALTTTLLLPITVRWTPRRPG